jgi:hypothetical protein
MNNTAQTASEDSSVDDKPISTSPDPSVDLIHEVVAAVYDPYVICMPDFSPLNGRGLEPCLCATGSLRDCLSMKDWRAKNFSEVPSVSIVWGRAMSRRRQMHLPPHFSCQAAASA